MIYMTTPLLPAATEAVAAEVRAACARKRMTGTALAQRLGMSQQALSRRMVGDIPFDVDQLFAIAEILDIPITEVIGNAAHSSELGLEFTTFGDKHRQTAAA